MKHNIYTICTYIIYMFKSEWKPFFKVETRIHISALNLFSFLSPPPHNHARTHTHTNADLSISCTPSSRTPGFFPACWLVPPLGSVICGSVWSLHSVLSQGIEPGSYFSTQDPALQRMAPARQTALWDQGWYFVVIHMSVFSQSGLCSRVWQEGHRLWS